MNEELDLETLDSVVAGVYGIGCARRMQVLRRVHTAQRPLLASVHIQVPHFGLRPHHLFGGERLDGRLQCLSPSAVGVLHVRAISY